MPCSNPKKHTLGIRLLTRSTGAAWFWRYKGAVPQNRGAFVGRERSTGGPGAEAPQPWAAFPPHLRRSPRVLRDKHLLPRALGSARSSLACAPLAGICIPQVWEMWAAWPPRACCLKLLGLAARRCKPSCAARTAPQPRCWEGFLRNRFLEQVNSCTVTMSKPSRLARPLSANTAPKSPSSRKEDFNSRSWKISLGEKMLRAGSEGNLVKQHQQVEITEVLVPRRAPLLKGNHLFHAVRWIIQWISDYWFSNEPPNINYFTAVCMRVCVLFLTDGLRYITHLFWK